MRLKVLACWILSCLLLSPAMAQEKSGVKFGKVSAADFSNKTYSIDPDANAVVIAEIGNSEFVGNNKNWFSIEFKHFRRVHILNKNGYDEANVSIPLYNYGDTEEDLDNIKAITYNLENGKVVETKLDKGSIFKDKINKYWSVKKFTFPNIKEGSIVEFEYKIKSDRFFHLHPWEFQGSIPILWSEYNVGIPSFFTFVFLNQGYQKPYIYDRKDGRTTYTVRDSRTVDASPPERLEAGITDHRWVYKNVPALKEESFITTTENHISKIEFQLSSQGPPLKFYNYMDTWERLAEELLHDEDFGSALDKNNGWLSDVVNPLITGAKTDLEKARNIFGWVRDNFTCTNSDGTYLTQSLKNVLKAKNGNVADVNLLLTAMLKFANIQAEPVLLSTRSHGYTYALYPLIDRFNYVICDATINGRTYYLDASEARLGFGRLSPECYNGHARVVNTWATPLELVADSLQERKVSSVMLSSNEKGEFIGFVHQVPGYYASHKYRDRIKAKGKEEFFKDIQKGFNQEVELSAPKIDSLNSLDDNIGISYDFKLKMEKEDVIYLNPMLTDGYKDNPFKSAERFYPVEMPYTIDDTYLFSLVIPSGYVVDELPKSTTIKLNEFEDGVFEYKISESGGTISLRSRIKLNKAFYAPEDYEVLREFFNHVVKKHNEQIVLKKKK
jgi:transglutaminase-like putative cysteine protease